MIIVEVTEVITYQVELPDGTSNPEDTAEDIIVNSEDRWEDYGKAVEERYAEVIVGVG